MLQLGCEGAIDPEIDFPNRAATPQNLAEKRASLHDDICLPTVAIFLAPIGVPAIGERIAIPTGEQGLAGYRLGIWRKAGR